MSSSPNFAWPSPWGFNEGDQPPPRAELFPEPNEFGNSDTGAFEDFLQHNGVFVNGISGKPAHSDSYMTILDSAATCAAVKLLEETFTPVQVDWQGLVNTWLGNPNMQPPLKMFATFLVAEFKLEQPKKWETT